MSSKHLGKRRARRRRSASSQGDGGSAALLGAAGRAPTGALALAGAALAAGALAAGALALYNQRRARAAERRYPPAGPLLTVDGVRLHAIRRGAGRPVLYLHGNGTTNADLDVSGLGAALGGEFAVTALDRPGYGHSERPRDRLWTASAQADLVAAALAPLGVERPIVVGHSWGAVVALALALEHPEAVAGLVLVSGYYYPTARADAVLFAPPALPVLGDAFRYTVAPPLGRLLLPKMLAKMFAPRPVPERFLRDFPIPLMLRPSQIKASAEDSAFLVPSAAALSEHYGRLRLPVSILAGSGDEIVTPARHARRLADEVPGARLRILPGIGHMLHYAAPDAVAGAVREVAARAG